MKKRTKEIFNIFFSERDIVTDKIIYNESDYRNISQEIYDLLISSKNLRNKKGIDYLFEYDKVFAKILFKLKEDKVLEMARLLSDISKKEFINILKKYDIDMVIPIPISEKRYIERGFNQVELILDKMNIRYSRIYRIKDTIRMKELYDKDKRAKNVHKIFYSDIDMSNKNILIVDDVITTGSTIFSLKSYLEYKYKNINIYVFCFAKAYTFGKENDE